MKRSAKIWLAVLLLLAVFCAVLVKHWKAGEPRRQSIKVLAALEANLHAAQSPAILDLLLIPPAIQSRTSLEQIEFLHKALQDEISPEGIRALQRNGRFGSLKELFPAEARAWATLAGVNLTTALPSKWNKKA